MKKKAISKKAVVKKTPAEKGKTKKAAPKVQKKETVPEPEQEIIDEECCCSECDSEPIEKNPARSYVLRDIWFESLGQVIDEEDDVRRFRRDGRSVGAHGDAHCCRRKSRRVISPVPCHSYKPAAGLHFADKLKLCFRSSLS